MTSNVVRMPPSAWMDAMEDAGQPKGDTMTNPADVLTAEFNGRVARSAVNELLGNNLYRLKECEGAIYNAIIRALREEREPVHAVTFQVRAPTWRDAVSKIESVGLTGYLNARTDITLVEPTERTS